MSISASRQSDLEYFRAREAEEREAEAASDCVYAREAHFEMAKRYADRAWSLEEANDAPYRSSGLWETIVEVARGPSRAPADRSDRGGQVGNRQVLRSRRACPAALSRHL
jgi:hypothetical protein